MIEKLKNWCGLAPMVEDEFKTHPIPDTYAGLKAKYIDLANDNNRLCRHVEQLQQDVGVHKANASLYSSFSYNECKAMVKFFKDWREAKRDDYQESVRIINAK